MVVYVVAGYLASRTDTVSIKLERGFSTEIRILRLVPQDLRMELAFRGDHSKRPELGDWINANSDGALVFARPGAAILLTASAPGAAPVTFEALPKSSHGVDRVGRNLTSDLSIRPGVWRWPPSSGRARIILHAGVTPVTLSIAKVDAALAGEAVELLIHPPLGFKSGDANVSWLWFWFLWPIMVVVQMLWAAVLIVMARRRW